MAYLWWFKLLQHPFWDLMDPTNTNNPLSYREHDTATMHEVREFDEAGNLVQTYVESGLEKRNLRVDVLLPEKRKKSWHTVLDVFLPAGYPHSVTDDYLPYQIYDSLQAFSSSIAGLLSSRAVLEGVGVGDASSTPTAAVLLSILQETAGRITTILFAHRLGKAIEPECKRYRLAADFFNDAAMVLDCLSPAFPRPMRVLLLSLSSVLRSLCGVAAGSAKASLSAHFAKLGNLGELNAKDSSQETIISLLGMLAGSLVVSYINTPIATWTVLLMLLAMHLSLNTLAVRSVCMRTLNRQRATLAFDRLFSPRTSGYRSKVELPTPLAISVQERIFHPSGRLSDGSYARIGLSLNDLVSAFATQQSRSTGSMKLSKNATNTGMTLFELLSIFEAQRYVTWWDIKSSTYLIVLKSGCTAEQQLKAWWHVCMLAALHPAQSTKVMEQKQHEKHESDEWVKQRLVESLGLLEDRFEGWAKDLKGVGWDLDVAALETKSGLRIERDSH